MIVNTTNRGWEIISQYAHGLLAGRIAAQLHPKYRPKQWVETLTAIIEHDDKQIDLDSQSCLSEAGVPLDFTLSKPGPQSEVVERAKGLMELAMNKSRWIALFISCHLDFLYDRGAVGKEMESFLKKQETFRKQALKVFGITEKQLTEYYQIVRFCDRLSLILCKNEVPAQGRKLEINTSISNETFFIRRDEKERLVIDPWCFKEKEFELSVEKRHLEQPTFPSAKALKKALDETDVTLKAFSFISM